ncbi:4Fe-4S binding protein [Planctomycetota bacterium]
MVCAAVAIVSGVACGESNFPQPEFESGYQMPVTGHTLPWGAGWEYLDVVVLAGALVLATLLALKWRSRKGLFTLSVFSILYFGFWRQGCVCPVGSLQNVTLALTDTGYALPLAVLAFFMLPLVFALLFGRTFCAAVCPLGALQDAVIFKPVKVPQWLAHALGMLAYIYLGLAILFVATGTGFVICRYDPFVSFFRMDGYASRFLIGGVLLVIGIFVARPYCRFLCPYGVLLGWMSRFSRRHLTITPDECVQCTLCEESCPFGAIRKPVEGEGSESRETGVRRLAILLLLLPVFVGAGVWAGGWAEGALSRSHPKVRLSERIVREDAGQVTGETIESEAFRQTGEPTKDFHARAEGLWGQFRSGGRMLGGFLGLAFGLSLIGVSVRWSRAGYEPDRTECLSCGRCFSYCPREHVRVKEQGVGHHELFRVP